MTKYLRLTYTLGQTGSYESMSICLQNVMKDVEQISKEGIEVDDKIFEVDLYLGADWKFLTTVCGIESLNCSHACIWCTCPKKDMYNGEKEWSLTDTSKGAHTIESICEGSKLSAKSKKKFTCARIPLFPMIPISRVVIDNLHLFLRITDNLVNLLITDLR